jgi:hypothetical protein
MAKAAMASVDATPTQKHGSGTIAHNLRPVDTDPFLTFVHGSDYIPPVSASRFTCVDVAACNAPTPRVS